MALSINLIDYVSVTTQNGTSADAGTQPGDNCHTIVVLNTDGSAAALVGIVTSGTNLTAANSATLTAGATLTLRIGTRIYRPCGQIGAAVRLRTEGVSGTPVLSFQFINASRDIAP